MPFEFDALRAIQPLGVPHAAGGMIWAYFGLCFDINLLGAPRPRPTS